jgi:hypothetical protein
LTLAMTQTAKLPNEEVTQIANERANGELK